MNSAMGATVLTLVIPGLHHGKPRAGLPRMWRINIRAYPRLHSLHRYAVPAREYVIVIVKSST